MPFLEVRLGFVANLRLWLVIELWGLDGENPTPLTLKNLMLIEHMADEFILIPGRTARQGTSLNEGKYTATYQEEINTLRMNPDDMLRMQIDAGDEVRMWNDFGEVTVPCISGKDELPQGLLFISYGDKSSQLMPGETHGTGMPDSKGLDVFVEKL